MVRLLLIIVVGLYSMSSNAQIEIFNESLKQEEPVKVVQYDSIRNITSQPYGTKGTLIPQHYNLIFFIST